MSHQHFHTETARICVLRFNKLFNIIDQLASVFFLFKRSGSQKIARCPVVNKGKKNIEHFYGFIVVFFKVDYKAVKIVFIIKIVRDIFYKFINSLIFAELFRISFKLRRANTYYFVRVDAGHQFDMKVFVLFITHSEKISLYFFSKIIHFSAPVSVCRKVQNNRLALCVCRLSDFR